MVPARVAAIGSAFGFASTITLDAGSRDGIAVGQTVVSGAGLLGRTVRVAPFTSTVLLLTDPGFTVGARLTRAGTVGLATGDGQRMVFELVEGGRVATGDALLTTGSDTFVPGVPVGRVGVRARRAGGAAAHRRRRAVRRRQLARPGRDRHRAAPGHTARAADALAATVMSARLLLGAATVLTALLLQTTVLARLPLPGGAPDLLLVLVVAFALVEGQLSGAVTGFAAGLAGDLVADHALGRGALVLAVVGHVTGLAHDERGYERSAVQRLAVVALSAVAATTLFAVEGLLLGDPRATVPAYVRALTGAPYDVALALLVVPGVALLVRRLDRDRLDRW